MSDKGFNLNDEIDPKSWTIQELLKHLYKEVVRLTLEIEEIKKSYISGEHNEGFIKRIEKAEKDIHLINKDVSTILDRVKFWDKLNKGFVWFLKFIALLASAIMGWYVIKEFIIGG